MPQNQQLDVLGELTAAAPDEQPQQRREPEIREGKEHPSMLPEPAAVDIDSRNLVLKPLTRTLSMNCGSGDSLNVSTWCGLSANARQIRLIADCDIPVAAAIDRVDQCVALSGWASSVVTMTRSTSSSPIVRGLPGRGSSWSPSSPRSANRTRHLPTVVSLQPKRAAMSTLRSPSAAAS